MAINLSSETAYYVNQAAEHARIAAALQREDVQEVLRRVPDGSGLSGQAWSDSAVLIRVHVHLGEDPAFADLAHACDGERYHLEVEQPLLDIPATVRVVARITGTAKLTAAEKDLLRAVGKLKTETQCREYLTCAA